MLFRTRMEKIRHLYGELETRHPYQQCRSQAKWTVYVQVRDAPVCDDTQLNTYV